MSITRGLAAVGFARVMAGALGALVVALAVFPTVAHAWTVESVGDGSILQISRSADDTAGTIVKVQACYGIGAKGSLPAWQQGVESGSVTELFNGVFDPEYRSVEFAMTGFSEVLVTIGSQVWSVINPRFVPLEVEVRNTVYTRVQGSVNTYLQGVRVPEFNADTQVWGGMSRSFGPGVSLASIAGTLPVSVVNTLAVSSLPSVTVSSMPSLAVSIPDSMSVAIPETLTVDVWAGRAYMPGLLSFIAVLSIVVVAVFFVRGRWR